jgi:hypothetical protein
MTQHIIDPELKTWATEAQGAYIDAVNQHGGFRKAAAALGVGQSTISQAVERARRTAAHAGYSPQHDMLRTVPDGFTVKGVSTYYDKDGKPRGQWVKSAADAQALAELRQAAFAAMAGELPRVAPVAGPADCTDKLCSVYTLTDSHVGMLSWAKETGEPWDLRIAEDTLVACFKRLVESAPRSAVGFVNQLGDFLHTDGLASVTPTSGHLLDSDGRYSKMVAVAIRVLRRVVDFALQHHGRVVLLVAEGNHDMAGSVWLRHMFAALYENEPRLTVIDSELPYYVHQHGKTMLAFHHGHLKKNDQLPLLFASQFAEVWGATKKRYAHTGHRHHVEIKEHSGMTVEQHSTLAARDAYAARGGWGSERQAQGITYHAEFGEVGRVTVTPEMVR